jgi:hypothetical protein
MGSLLDGFRPELQPTSEKATLIKRHHRNQQRLHVHPFVLSAPRQLGMMDSETLYDFCRKGCAVYITTPPVHGGVSLLEMFNYLYGALHPQTDLDLALGGFPSKFIACWAATSPREVSDILEAHRGICDQVTAPKDDTVNTDADNAASPEADAIRHSQHELHPLFRALLLVVDKPNWQENDVQLVRTGDDRDLCGGPIDFDPLRFNFYIDDDGDILRGPFKKVMSLVIDMKQQEDDAKFSDWS